MTIPFHVNLKDQVAVVTGGGGILCSVMADALAQCGAKVAILDLKPEMAQKAADEITKAGGVAKAFACNVLEKASIEQAHAQVKAAFGPVDILINGAGGNHPKGTTSKEFLSREDLTAKKDGVVTFYDLTVEGIQFVFNLNFLGTFLPTQVFSKDMVREGARQHHQHLLHERLQAADQDPGLQRGQGGREQFHPVARRAFLEDRRPRQCPRARASSSPTRTARC